MLYFFHHYELPVIIQQAQLQQLLIRNRNTMNQQQQQQPGTGPGGQQRGRGPHLRIPLPILLPFIRQRLNNDNNNNMNEFLRGTLNVMNRMASVLRGQIRVTLNIRRDAEQENNEGNVANTERSNVEANVNVTEGASTSTASTGEQVQEETDGENQDTRSNFQRNYEENNFLFPPDILMRERDRVNQVSNNQTATNVNNNINSHHRHRHHENLAETLYSVAPIPGRIELTTTATANLTRANASPVDIVNSNPITTQEQLSQINRDTLIKNSDIVVSTENHQILEPNVISGESDHDFNTATSSSSRNNYCNNKEIHNEQQETNNTLDQQNQQQQQQSSENSQRDAAAAVDNDDEDDNKHDKGGGTSLGNNVTL